MNDCLWGAIGVCNKDCQCKSYISMNSEEGQALSIEWEKIVENVLPEFAITFAEANGFKKVRNK